MPLHDLNRVMIRRNRHKAEKAGRLSSRLKPAGLTILLLLSLLLTGGMITAAGLYVKVTADLPPVEQAARFFDPADGLILQPSRLYDRSGETELLTLDNPGSQRVYVWLDTNQDPHFSPLLAKAVVALHQPDFWQSIGADWTHWSDPEPHTLAENLVSRLLLWQEDDTLERAVRMRLLAWQMTSTYGREKILEWYLNSAAFGRRVTGAENAALVYFGRSSVDLNEAEVSLLAGLSTAPALNPHDSPQAADDLMRSTLDKLAEAGVITGEMKQTALETGLIIQKAPDPAALTTSPAFTRLALQQLSRLVSDDRLALGGLQIRTTLDLAQQEQLDCVLKAQLNRLESTGTETNQKCAAARLLPALPPWKCHFRQIPRRPAYWLIPPAGKSWLSMEKPPWISHPISMKTCREAQY
jgi:membrane peptidoglycan carboxypeptidase